MANAGSLLVSREIGLHKSLGCCNTYNNVMRKSRIHIVTIDLTSHGLKQNPWTLQLLRRVPVPVVPVSSKCNIFVCQSFMVPRGGSGTSILKSATLILARTYDALCGSLLIVKLFPAIGLIAFAVWGVQPLIRLGRNLFLHKTDDSWKKSNVNYVTTHYICPLLLWFGATLICRSLDPLVLSSDINQAIKQRLLNFVQSLSTVVALAYCLSSLIEQAKKFFIETNDSGEARNMGFDFAGKTVYTAVWVAALSLFMELLGFSTQKWLTAGGLGTVLLTLAGREILTNFLSSIMIHATRPFVLNEWIQTKIDGYEVSGTVEHVGWWSPTIIRGDDREAVHIPNHKFTVNVVRNLSQKTHWRIKSHLAISHFDVNKINNVVADMRKVLAKNPQIEQQRLHRRVFLDYIDPENQALMVLVSCFVKTSHFEEFLCVKEAILLDLLRVISHHRARLATPIRTVQKSYREADLDVSFADTIISQSTATNDRPLLLIEPSYKMSSDDKVKASTRSTSPDEEKGAEPEAAYITDMNASDIAGSSSDHEADKSEEKSSETQTQNPRPVTSERIPEMPAAKNEEREKTDESMVIKSISTTPNGGTSGKFWAAMPLPASDSDDMASVSLRTKEDGELGTVSTAMSLSPLEENILLGLALEGSKRTLPIEEETPSMSESRETSVHRTEAKGAQVPAVPGATRNA